MNKAIIKKMMIAVIIAGVLSFALYKVIQAENTKVTYIEVVVAKNELPQDHKVVDEDLAFELMREDRVKNVITDKKDILNKYLKDTIYIGESIRKENIKKISKVEAVDPAIREVRIITDIASFGGVGKGDKADVTYVGRLNKEVEVGKLLYQGLEVKSVLNSLGEDLDNVQPDKFNNEMLDPSYVVFQVEQDKALEIQTLQGKEKEVCFKLSKWTKDSQLVITPPGIQTKNQIIYKEQEKKMEEQE